MKTSTVTGMLGLCLVVGLMSGCASIQLGGAPATPLASSGAPATAPPSSGATETTPPPVTPPAVLPAISDRAELDRNLASITLPVERYGMTDQEIRTMLAAQHIAFAQCVTGSQTVTEVTLSAASRALKGGRPMAEWRYGFWDADFMAQYGWIPITDQLDLTQRAGDIEAAYGQAIIVEHQAELVALKALADQRVADASTILRSFGVI